MLETHATNALLWIHIATGFLCLLTGAWAMMVSKRKGSHTTMGVWYHWLMVLMCGSAVVLGLVYWQRAWHLFLLAIFSYSGALKGYLAAKKRPANWLRVHISGMAGSYIGVVTAFLLAVGRRFDSVPQPVQMATWILPTLIGTILITRAQFRWATSKRQTG